MQAAPSFPRFASAALAVWLAITADVVAQTQAPVPPRPSAQELAVCVACDKNIPLGVAWKHPRGLVCDPCHKLDTRCVLCGLPTVNVFAKTSDGRRVCKYDMPNAVLDVAEAKRIFEEVRSELSGWAEGKFAVKSTEIAVNLFDVDYWNFKDGKPVEKEMRRQGFSQSRPAGKSLVHNVLLLSAQFKTDTAMTCAHEYTHLWINENRPDGREIDPDTMEAICEAAAFQLATAKASAEQQEKIRQNPYTHGRILPVLEAVKDQGFAALLEWVKSGTGKTLEPNGLAAFANGAPPRPRAFVPYAPPPPPPSKLLFRGVSGTKQRRFALINDQTFMVNDEAKVKVADKSVLVKCLEIRNDSVVVRVDGGEPVTIYLGAQ
jgi:hypothetical protein